MTQDHTFWSQKQNLANPQSLNSYAYADDNPINKSDPDGLAASSPSIQGILQQLVNLLRQYVAAVNSPNGGRSNNSMPGPSMGANITMPMRPRTWDPSTDKKITQLDPRVRQPATNFINDVQDWEGTKLRVVEGYRSEDRQNELYEQGRTRPGPVVTNARGGQSYHNYGQAIDVAPVVNGQVDWNTPVSSAIADYGKKQGFEWGGNFSNLKDNPHFQIPLTQLKTYSQ